MPFDFSSDYARSHKLAFERVRYAAFLYDRIKKDFNVTHSKAVVMACQEANIAPPELKLWLPNHNWERKVIRNHRIINCRASGWSINLICNHYNIHRSTANRIIGRFQDKMNCVNMYQRRRISGRLKAHQLEFDFSGKT